ncbi:tRNA pseudouridine(55) synthase TruB [Malacoplasma muris]|uniref:tRNA pseudouridine(55) synthase TruB n=1 Tax=Malacoplasma muris TaxID=2119 RepID=UPI00398E9CAB
MDKIIVINKPIGLTSNDVVQIIKKSFGFKKVGHAGTLDPNASGVLILGINHATKLLSSLLLDDKEYIASIQFGYSTDTYDMEGKITNQTNKKIVVDKITNHINNLLQQTIIDQTPPLYSAIKKDGKKLYEYARNNISVQIEPRKVKLLEANIISFNFESQILEIKLKVSKGFYVRSFANDLGLSLDNYATLIKLIRTKSGNYSLEDAIDFDFSKYMNNKKLDT